MSDRAVTPYVFLDTEVFDRHNLDFASPNLRRLVRLTSAKAVHLLLTIVTRGEVLAHLDAKAKKAFGQIKDFLREARMARRILPHDAVAALESVEQEAACEALRREFDEFIKETVATVLPLSAVNPEAVFAKYFAGVAPFGEGKKKKNEFPDAFACAALQGWCDANGGAKIYVVSSDGDWSRACGGDCRLISVARIDELLELFADSVVVTAIHEALEEMREYLAERIAEKALDLDYYTGDQLVEGEVESVDVDEVEIVGFHVVEVKDGVAAVSVDVQLKVTASVTAVDSARSIRDPDTRDLVYFSTASCVVTRTLDSIVEVTLDYEVGQPEVGTIRDVKFVENFVDLNVEEDELLEDEDDQFGVDFEYHTPADMEFHDPTLENMGPPEYEPPAGP